MALVAYACGDTVPHRSRLGDVRHTQSGGQRWQLAAARGHGGAWTGIQSIASFESGATEGSQGEIELSTASSTLLKTL